MSEAKFDYLIGQTCGSVSSFSTNTHDFDNVLSILNLHQDNKVIVSLQKISLFALQNPLGGRQKVRQEAKDGHCGAFVLRRENLLDCFARCSRIDCSCTE